MCGEQDQGSAICLLLLPSLVSEPQLSLGLLKSKPLLVWEEVSFQLGGFGGHTQWYSGDTPGVTPGNAGGNHGVPGPHAWKDVLPPLSPLFGPQWARGF